MAFSDVFPSYVKRLGYEGARHELRYIGPESWALMERLALSYASVRDATLREAAGELSRIFLAKWERHGADFSPEGVMRDAVDATLGALVNTAPREAAPSSPRDEEAPHAR